MDMANVLMVHNLHDYDGVKALAAELGAQFIIDPTITPMMDGDRSILSLNVDEDALRQVFHNESLAGNVEEFCAVHRDPAGGPELSALQRGPHGLLCLALWRRLSLCPIPIALRQRAAHKVRRHLASFSPVA